MARIAGSPKHYTAMQVDFVEWYNLGETHNALKGNARAIGSNSTSRRRTSKELIEIVAET